MKKTIIGAVLIVLIGVGFYFFNKNSDKEILENEQENAIVDNTNTNATTTVPAPVVDLTKTVIGQSVEGRPITAYHYGTGTQEILFVGGIHGGYSFNTSLFSFELMDYLDRNSSFVPADVKVTVIPVMNPDGLYRIAGKADRFVAADIKAGVDTVPGRFNANNVDLNRNFDCDWAPTSKWQNRDVNGGASAFSEPESVAVKNYVESKDITAVVTYYSASGGVFASNCRNGVSAETLSLTNAYANASGYKAFREFNFYEITGDMVNWFAKKEIPAISVLLTNHRDTEFAKNIKGVESILNYYAE